MTTSLGPPSNRELESETAFVGQDPLMMDLLERVAQVAATRATVLISGESGTGKELIAEELHRRSRRSKEAFVRVNCAALAETLLESEIFGHEKGAFTGAGARRLGRFEQAHRGTLFLDEVSEIPKPVQVKLLRFLQERELERVGGNQTIRVDVRIIAATNRDLRGEVEAGRFREDLYYRLNVVSFNIPPLRERLGDIPLLARHFVRCYVVEHELPQRYLSDAAMAALLDHPWPGNVRELQNVIEQAVILARESLITPANLPLQPSGANVLPKIPGTTLAEIERYAVLQTLKALDGSVTRTAAVLGVSRRTLQYRLRQWKVTDRTSGYLPLRE